MREFIPPADERSLVVDTSAGLVLGAPPGLDRFAAAVTPLLPLVDGVVTGPGQARVLGQRSRQDAALLVRADWTNALRADDFVLPPGEIHATALIDAAGALDLGASAAVIRFLLGYDEGVEAGCLKRTVALALEGLNSGLPLIVEVLATGPRVALPDKAIELGVSYALEGGASGVVVSWSGAESFRTIRQMAGECPVWLKPAALDPAGTDTLSALDLGAVGLWLDERLFAGPDPLAVASAFRALVHGQEGAR